jgi:hypothetical protein
LLTRQAQARERSHFILRPARDTFRQRAAETTGSPRSCRRGSRLQKDCSRAGSIEPARPSHRSLWLPNDGAHRHGRFGFSPAVVAAFP